MHCNVLVQLRATDKQQPQGVQAHVCGTDGQSILAFESVKEGPARLHRLRKALEDSYKSPVADKNDEQNSTRPSGNTTVMWVNGEFERGMLLRTELRSVE